MRKAVLFLFLAACKSNNNAAPPDAAPPLAPVAAIVDAGAPRDAGARVLTAEQRATVIKELNAGRRLSRAKNWGGAIDAFHRALVLSPDDARVLSELGWAEFNANDLPRAEAANARALANAREPSIRAPILYNAGRVADAKGDKAAAAKNYRDSLALRDNAEVKRRLSALGIDAGVDGARSGTPDDGIRGTPCAQGFSSIGAMCLCLDANRTPDGLLMMPEDEKPLCAQDQKGAPLGDPRVATVTFGAGPDRSGETLHYLTVRETDRIRLLAILGEDYDPGAFGVHNSITVTGGSSRNVGGHVIVVVKSKVSDNDFNYAGLELCSNDVKQETVCALSDDHNGSKCTAAIPVESEASCGFSGAIDEKDADEGTKELLAEIKRSAFKRSAKTSWTIAADGTVTVTVLEGPRDAVPAGVLEPQKLF